MEENIRARNLGIKEEKAERKHMFIEIPKFWRQKSLKIYTTKAH
jgi:hypothetical protein